jgi:cold shock CspA family protein
LFICKQEASSSEKIVGGQINASGRISIVAGGRIVNDGGNVFAIGDVNLDAPEIIAHGRPLHTAILRDKGLKALFGDTWAKIYANDQGGGFTAQQGQIFLHGTAIQDRGYYAAGKGIEGDIQVVEAARREPVTIEDHLGILFW